MVTEQQINEWVENPVTEAFRECVIREQAEALAMRGMEAYSPFDAARTQETLANLNGYEDAFSIVQSALEGDWSMFEGVDDEEL